MIVAGCDVGMLTIKAVIVVEDAPGTKVSKIPADPQIIGALGAAFIAGEARQ
jgi:activator of 2-hydroxyglutaryl-CoA dehydratase